MTKTLEQAFATARTLPAARQEIVAFYVERAMANEPVHPDDAQTMRGLQQALAGEGYTEVEARVRMNDRINAARST
jgi:hypothetical protein